MPTRKRVQEQERTFGDSSALGSHMEQVAELQEEPVLDAAHA